MGPPEPARECGDIAPSFGPGDHQASIGRQLHDVVVPQLFVVSTGLAALRRRTDDPLVQELVDATNQALTDLRGISRSRQSQDDTNVLQLLIRLEKQTTIVGRLGGCAVTFECGDDAPLCGDLASDVIAVVWELIANAIRHGAADQVNVSIGASGDQLIVRVDDNGVWKDSVDPLSSGLTGLEVRAVRHDGTVRVHHAETGTSVEWCVVLCTTVHMTSLR